jgi:hypothetical protein
MPPGRRSIVYSSERIAPRAKPLCAATASRTELKVPSRSGWWSGIAIRFGGFRDDVTTSLVRPRVLPSALQDVGETRARDVARDLHATSTISSRTR